MNEQETRYFHTMNIDNDLDIVIKCDGREAADDKIEEIKEFTKKQLEQCGLHEDANITVGTCDITSLCYREEDDQEVNQRLTDLANDPNLTIVANIVDVEI